MGMHCDRYENMYIWEACIANTIKEIELPRLFIFDYLDYIRQMDWSYFFGPMMLA